MLAAPYVEAIGKMERRFLTTSVVPTIILLTAYVSVAIASFGSFAEVTAWLSDRSVSEQLLLGVAMSAVVWFIAGLFASNWRKIVRFYEGYPVKRWLLASSRRSGWRRSRLPGFGYHHARKAHLADTNTNAFYRSYPLHHDRDTLPTTVGNILLSSERYGLDRYGFEMNVLWTRFAWCLPETVQQSLDRFKEEHQLPLALSFTSGAFSVLAGATVMVAGGSPELFLVSTLGGLGLAVFAYLLAIERTEEYAEQLRATIDLHHTKLRDAWSGTIPDIELEHWFEDARLFFERGRESLEAHRLKRARREERAAASEPPADPPSAFVPSAVSVPAPPSGSVLARRSPRWPLKLVDGAWAAFCGRVRLLWIAVLVALVPIAGCSGYLYFKTQTVLIAQQNVGPGGAVVTEAITMRSVDVPPGAVRPREEARVALKALNAGEVITASNSWAADESSWLTIPTDSSIPSGQTFVADVVIAPCGLLFENVVVTGGASERGAVASLQLTRPQTLSLAGCSPESATVVMSSEPAEIVV